jgi:hypothetical protein
MYVIGFVLFELGHSLVIIDLSTRFQLNKFCVVEFYG